MKKLTPKRRRWLFVRARKELRRRRHQPYMLPIRYWSGEDVEFAIATREPTHMPSIMCFERNTVETTSVLERLRRRLLKPISRPTWSLKSKKGKRKIKGFLDFSSMNEISTAAALVVAAEYERMVTIIGSPPPLINLDEWNDDVFKRLLELGFFSSVGITPTAREHHMRADQDVLTLQFLSGSNAEETEQAGRMLEQLGSFLDPDQELPEEISIPLMSALSEAMTNVRRHAYPVNHRFAFRHVGRWWLTGSADRRRRNLTIVIYDQGATIPITYARASTASHIAEWISRQWSGAEKHAFALDGVHIAAAAKFGNSQTDLPHRGKGLPDMQNAIDVCKNGRLMILSRGGRYVYHGGDRSEQSFFPSSIGGTLIEWTLNLPSLGGEEVHDDDTH